jgi:hypothetical protein
LLSFRGLRSEKKLDMSRTCAKTTLCQIFSEEVLYGFKAAAGDQKLIHHSAMHGAYFALMIPSTRSKAKRRAKTRCKSWPQACLLWKETKSKLKHTSTTLKCCESFSDGDPSAGTDWQWLHEVHDSRKRAHDFRWTHLLSHFRQRLWWTSNASTYCVCYAVTVSVFAVSRIHFHLEMRCVLQRKSETGICSGRQRPEKKSTVEKRSSQLMKIVVKITLLQHNPASGTKVRTFLCFYVPAFFRLWPRLEEEYKKRSLSKRSLQKTLLFSQGRNDFQAGFSSVDSLAMMLSVSDLKYIWSVPFLQYLRLCITASDLLVHKCRHNDSLYTVQGQRRAKTRRKSWPQACLLRKETKSRLKHTSTILKCKHNAKLRKDK